MTEFFIKPYSFVNFVDKDWVYWKARNMTEARLRLWERHEDNMPPPQEGDESSYAYAGNQTKIPILWNADDYKFLSQFPPALWTRALQWRYNEGLIEASKLRDQDPQHNIEAVPNERNELVFKNDDGKKFVFSNVYTGFRNLLQHLEKPIKYHGEHNPPGAESGAPGVKDIDPFQTDINHPQHPSKYTHGLMDYDVTNPVEANDDYIDAIADDDINLPQGQERTPANIQAARERMKKSRQHSFAGMSVLQPIVTSRLLNTWIKAQGLGLLGDLPQDAKDPHTGEPVQATKGSPKDANGLWDSHAGEPSEGGQRLPLSVPLIKRNLNYKIVKPSKDGGEVEESVNQPVTMPYLNPGVLLPRIVDLSPEQRQKFAERSGFDVSKACPGVQGLSWADIEMKCKAAKQAGQPDDLYNIVRNFDILSPEQRKHMVDNQRNLLHLASAKFGNNKEDFWSQPGQHYAVGFTPNKAKREILPSDMSKEQLKTALDKYYDKLLWEADKSITYFLSWARRGEKLPPQVLDMMDRIKTDLAQVCAALIGLNLNHPNMGIRDPEVGLVGVEAKADKKELEVARKNYAFNFARDLSQAAFGDVGSRRARQKNLTGGTVSLDAPSGSSGEGGSLKDVQAAQSGGIGGGAKMPWYTRRQQLNPATIADEEGAYPIARLIWNVPQIGHKIDKFFQTQRNRLAAHLGGQYAQLADNARDKLKVEVDAMQELIAQAGDELSKQGIEGNELEQKAQELALQRLPDKLKQMRPDLYGDMEEKDLQALIQRNKQVTRVKLDPEMQQAEDEYMDEFFTQIISGKKWPFPEYNPEIEDFGEGPEMGVENLKDQKGQPLDAQGVVTFLRSVWTEKGAQKYAVPLLVAISKQAGQPMDEKQAQQAIMAAGIQPEGAAPAEKPTQAAPDPAKMPQPAAAKPAMAATDLAGLLASLPNNPSVYEQLIARKAELAAHKPALLAALQKLREANKQKKINKQPLSPEEYNAQVALGALATQI